MFIKNKKKILSYLNSGEEIAAAPGYALDHKTGEYTRVELVAFADDAHEWTSEDIYNFEKNDEIFNEALFLKIIKN